MDTQQSNKIEAAVFRRLLAHLDERTDVQNIDLMNLAGFCRNCLSKWYRAACEEDGIEVDYDTARERVYGMPYSDWKREHQAQASEDQQAKFAALQVSEKGSE
ncbi:MAG: DUF1244 domain-containing protein [Gammaproteobacteria bacterium]|nr:DUF1244 domain-containing protein [Gammaproteobacteria bacterium]